MVPFSLIGWCLFLFSSGTLQCRISELPWPVAVNFFYSRCRYCAHLCCVWPKVCVNFPLGKILESSPSCHSLVFLSRSELIKTYLWSWNFWFSCWRIILNRAIIEWRNISITWYTLFFIKVARIGSIFLMCWSYKVILWSVCCEIICVHYMTSLGFGCRIRLDSDLDWIFKWTGSSKTTGYLDLVHLQPWPWKSCPQGKVVWLSGPLLLLFDPRIVQLLHLQKAQSSGEDEAECSEKDDAEGKA